MVRRNLVVAVLGLGALVFGMVLGQRGFEGAPAFEKLLVAHGAPTRYGFRSAGRSRTTVLLFEVAGHAGVFAYPVWAPHYGRVHALVTSQRAPLKIWYERRKLDGEDTVWQLSGPEGTVAAYGAIVEANSGNFMLDRVFGVFFFGLGCFVWGVLPLKMWRERSEGVAVPW